MAPQEFEGTEAEPSIMFKDRVGHVCVIFGTAVIEFCGFKSQISLNLLRNVYQKWKFYTEVSKSLFKTELVDSTVL